MVDWDAQLDGIGTQSWEVPSAHGRCCVCSREMYKTCVQVGEATEWRHSSTGRPLSWCPEKHNATPARVRSHAHRWDGEAGAVHCTFTPCDAETVLLARECADAPKRPFIRHKPSAVTARKAAARRAAEREAARGVSQTRTAGVRGIRRKGVTVLTD